MSGAAEIDQGMAVLFLETAFEPDDWLAVFLKTQRTGRVGQRVVPLLTVANPRFQDWLIRENRAGASIYVSVNSLRQRATDRRRNAVGAVRHVFLDADTDLDAVLASISARADLPEPSYVLRTSERRGHVFWRAKGFRINDVEMLEKQLAGELHTDLAATACSQLTRLPGYLNHKRAPAYRVTVQYGAAVHVTHMPSNFQGFVTTSDGCRGLPGDLHQHLKTDTSVLHRARRYLAAVPPAVSGRRGDVHTFRVCCRLVRGFAIGDADALALLAEWNATCQPPWSERELLDKLQRARRYGREPIGELLGGRL